MCVLLVVGVLAGAIVDVVVVAGAAVVVGAMVDDVVGAVVVEALVVDVICLVVGLRFLCGLGGSVREDMFKGLVCCVVFRVQIGLRDIKGGMVFCGGFCCGFGLGVDVKVDCKGVVMVRDISGGIFVWLDVFGLFDVKLVGVILVVVVVVGLRMIFSALSQLFFLAFSRKAVVFSLMVVADSTEILWLRWVSLSRVLLNAFLR